MEVGCLAVKPRRSLDALIALLTFNSNPVVNGRILRVIFREIYIGTHVKLVRRDTCREIRVSVRGVSPGSVEI